MELKPDGTKLALIEAAGELFAEYGLRGTGIRAIAEKAEANVAAVNYHFGSKENLYAAVLRYTLERTRTTTLTEWMNSPNGASPERAAEVLRQFIRERFETLFSPHLPGWCVAFVTRSLHVPSPALREAVQDVFEPDHCALESVVMQINPGLTKEECQLYVFSLMGMITFYVFAEIPIQMILESDEYPRAFLEAAADHVTRLVFGGLGVPEMARA